MILKIEGHVSEVTEFLDQINRPRVIPFPVIAGCELRVAGCKKEKKKEADTAASDIKKEKKPAGKPYSGGKNNPEEKKEADTLAAYPKQEAGQAASKKIKRPVKKTKQKKAPKTLKGAGSLVTLEEIKKVDLSECNTIPEAISKLQIVSNVSGNRLCELLEVDKSSLSQARN